MIDTLPKHALINICTIQDFRPFPIYQQIFSGMTRGINYFGAVCEVLRNIVNLRIMRNLSSTLPNCVEIWGPFVTNRWLSLGSRSFFLWSYDSTIERFC